MKKQVNSRNRSLRQIHLLTSPGRLFGLIALCILLQACTATKLLPEGETFYEGAEIKILAQGEVPRQGGIKEDLQELITPKPNKKFLGNRPGVWFFYKAGEPKKKKGFRNFVKTKLGRVPRFS